MHQYIWTVTAFLTFYVFGGTESGYHEWKTEYDKSKKNASLEWWPFRATQGMPVPMPQSMKFREGEQLLTIVPTQFEIIPIGAKCDILSHAVKRYFGLILEGEHTSGGWPFNEGKTNTYCDDNPILLHKLFIDVGGSCEGGIYPSPDSDESYSLEVLAFGAVLKAPEIWGALRGLETFSQLVYRGEDDCLKVAQLQVTDFPRFSYRGILLDTSRHFLSMKRLYQNLDAMSYTKMNVFHWHIVDDESFPYQSITYPSLTTKGAFSSNHIYTQDDVAAIIEYARLRGIRVIPEFDTPGHTFSWGAGLPGFLTECYKDGKPNGKAGPVDPTNDNNYKILENLLKEWKKVFPDQYIHLGGDEVSFNCWKSNPKITNWMIKQNITGDYGKLENYYEAKLLGLAASHNMKYIVWQDPLGNGVKLDPKTVVHVWLGSSQAGIQAYLKEITSAGYQTILSSPWYLNYLANPYGWGYMENYYKADPQDFNGTSSQKALIKGGEACMWGEYTDDTNVLVNLWPTAAIVAERLWSSKDMTDFHALLPRIAEMQCRFSHRNLPAKPIAGPGSCDKEYARK